MEARYAFISEPTFYAKHGDWFAYLCVVVSLLAVLVRFNVRGAVLRS
jgi:apolipoprotein N-acyltransferase